MKFGASIVLKHICTSCMEYFCETTVTKHGEGGKYWGFIQQI